MRKQTDLRWLCGKKGKKGLLKAKWSFSSLTLLLFSSHWFMYQLKFLLLTQTQTSCASCANFSVLKRSDIPDTLSSSASVCLQNHHDKPHSLPVYVSCASSRSRRHIQLPDLIIACWDSLFEDKGFSRLRQAASGKEIRRRMRLAAEWEEKVGSVGWVLLLRGLGGWWKQMDMEKLNLCNLCFV